LITCQRFSFQKNHALQDYL